MICALICRFPVVLYRKVCTNLLITVEWYFVVNAWGTDGERPEALARNAGEMVNWRKLVRCGFGYRPELNREAG